MRIFPAMFRARRVAALAVTLVVSGCIDDRATTEPGALGRRALMSVSAQGPTYTLLPSGGDDTEALRAALAAAVAEGPGATVALGEGVFHLRNVVLSGFRGTVRGAGRERTVLQPVEGLRGRLIDIDDGAVTLADLTLDGSVPCALAMLLRVTGTDVATRIERVGFRGSGAVPTFGLYYGGAARYLPAVGTHELYESAFTGLNFPVVYAALDSRFTMGAPGRGNRIEGAVYGLLTHEVSGGSADIAYNDIQASEIGVRVWHGYMAEMHPDFGYPPLRNAAYRLAHNTISVSGIADAIFVRDASWATGGSPLATVVVEANEVRADVGCAELGICGGIAGVGARDVVVRDNRITGRADAGIYLGLFAPDEHWMLLANDVQGVNTVFAPVLLGERSGGVTVVGGGNDRIAVLDFGSGNTITGVSNVRGAPPGPAIREALPPKWLRTIPSPEE